MSQRNGTEERALHPIRYPLPRCPSCDSEELASIVESETFDVHFLCRDCTRCWHVEGGYVHRMAPDVCHGCPHVSECRPVFEADYGRSTTTT
jgi:hypothetical protein